MAKTAGAQQPLFLLSRRQNITREPANVNNTSHFRSRQSQIIKKPIRQDAHNLSLAQIRKKSLWAWLDAARIEVETPPKG
jgi:hypothetical protein